MVVKKRNLKNGGPLCRLAAGFRSVNYVRWASRRATIGRNLRIRSYRAIPRKLRRHPHWPRVDRAEFSGSAYALFQRLRLRVGFGPTRLSSLASQTRPLTDVIDVNRFLVSEESHPGIIANLVLRLRVFSLARLQCYSVSRNRRLESARMLMTGRTCLLRAERALGINFWRCNP
jgi:hypothetical protein